MNMIVRNITEELIHAYVDSQLSPDEHIRFERIMENDLALTKKVQDYKNQNNLLHDLFDPVLEEPVPQKFSKQSTKKKSNTALLKMVASFMLLFTGGLAGWFANEQVPNNRIVSIPNFAHTATIAHLVFVPEVKHPVEVTADQEKHLVKWLSKRLGKKIITPDLNTIGFGLVGGRLLPSETGAAAQFMYENSAGERLTLFVRNAKNGEVDTAFRFYEEVNTNAFYWIDGNMGYAIVGNINKKQLLGSANLVYQQFSL